MTDRLREAVRRGASWLDRQRPGWAGRIDEDTLNMYDCARCVLGQVFGHYQIGLTALYASEHDAWGTDYGFNDCEGDYASLRDLWLAEVLARRAGEGD